MSRRHKLFVRRIRRLLGPLVRRCRPGGLVMYYKDGIAVASEDHGRRAYVGF